jgi:hypothetical protein
MWTVLRQSRPRSTALWHPVIGYAGNKFFFFFSETFSGLKFGMRTLGLKFGILVNFFLYKAFTALYAITI